MSQQFMQEGPQQIEQLVTASRVGRWPLVQEATDELLAMAEPLELEALCDVLTAFREAPQARGELLPVVARLFDDALKEVHAQADLPVPLANTMMQDRHVREELAAFWAANRPN